MDFKKNVKTKFLKNSMFSETFIFYILLQRLHQWLLQALMENVSVVTRRMLRRCWTLEIRI
jgi:hypothetical protein